MKNFLDPNHSGPKFLDQIFLDSKFFWIKNSIGPKKILTQIFKFPNILKYIWTQIFLDPNFFYFRSFWTIFFKSYFWMKHFFWQIFFIHKWTQHFLHPNILFKLMTIWLNLNLQSNCLSLDWAPAQLQLVLAA